MRISPAIEPNHRKVKAAVGAENLAVALGVGSDCQPGCSYGECIEKLTTIDHNSPLLFDHTTIYPGMGDLHLELDRAGPLTALAVRQKISYYQ